MTALIPGTAISVQSPALRRAARCLLGCALVALLPRLPGKEQAPPGACR
ncbi:hypothetical protein SAMN05660662_0172 [Blastococcus aurantiacus]|uniref:Uncharacterized protein n=1 Tax=Blastococcus aurantiacus TaxID=1550231 RepID=A0A1G7R5I8_9ACTN|nr:hypothetical protein [Blastococcus aurantiacus]SDG05419.1 hypothetical protein SAMN05660662_0172 [Blastococcus aurantiacus]